MKRLRLLGGIVFVVSLLWTAGIIFSTPKAEAATIDVAAGLGDTETNDHCSLAEALANINDQETVFIDCSPTGVYGDDDTLILPSGTIVLNSNLPQLERSISIEGQGVGDTIIDGDGSFTIFKSLSSDPDIIISISGMTFTSIAGAAVYTQGSTDVIIEDLEIDGGGAVPSSGNMYGLYLMNDTSLENTLTATNIYIHNYHTDLGSIHTFVVGGNGGGITNVDFKNITIDDISNSGIINVLMVGNGVYGGGFNPHTSTGTLSNVTISNIQSGSAIGTLFADAMTATGESTVNIDVNNITIKDIHGSASPYSGTAGLGTAALAIDSSAVATANVIARNVLLSDITTDGSLTNCAALDLNPIFGGSGTVNTSFSSSGGNISDDTSCTDYFTDPTDQNNVDTADINLGTLGDYGGSVPTIPLLSGSIAIDAGVTASGVTKDARGVDRPQCADFDSGAFEYNGTCPVNEAVEPADISLTGSRVTPAPILSGMNLTYDLTIKNNGPGVSNDTSQYMLINIPVNTNFNSISVDNNADYDLECYDQGPIAALEGGAYNQYTGNGVTCIIDSLRGYIDVNEEIVLTVNLTATSDFTIGDDTVRASVFNPFNDQEPDYDAVFQAYLEGAPLFDVPVNNIINLTYGVNDEQQTNSDSDPIPDSVEDAAPGNGDGNNDGTPDSEQSNVTSLPNASGDYITLAVPEGVVIDTTSIAKASSLSSKDMAYNYPLGLVSFTATTDVGATIPIELYFYTSEKASTFTPRKYNATNQTYATLSTLTQTSLTQTTINNLPVLKLAYQLQEGGSLDQDGIANGTIVDPVGLAQATVGVPETGIR